MLDAIRSMKARMPWGVAHKVLSGLDISPGMGWEKTLSKINDRAIDAAKSASILNALLEHIVCGEKYCKIQEASRAELDSLIPVLRAVTIPTSSFSAAYPLSLSDDELSDIYSDPVLTAVEDFNNGLARIIHRNVVRVFS